MCYFVELRDDGWRDLNDGINSHVSLCICKQLQDIAYSNQNKAMEKSQSIWNAEAYFIGK